MHPMFTPIVTFAKNNPSVTMVLVAAGLSAGPAEPGIISILVHGINLACLFGIRKTAKDSKYNFVTGALFFLVMVTALIQDRFMIWSYVLQGASALVTLYMWWFVMSGKDSQVVGPGPAMVPVKVDMND